MTTEVPYSVRVGRFMEDLSQLSAKHDIVIAGVVYCWEFPRTACAEGRYRPIGDIFVWDSAANFTDKIESTGDER